MKTERLFSDELKHLMKITNMKNATVAAVLGYDISYISKWISGGKLPSARNITALIDTLVNYICESSSEQQMHSLCLAYDASCMEDVREIMKDGLYNAYKEEKQEKTRGRLSLGPQIQYYAIYPTEDLISDISAAIWKNGCITCMIDLFNLSKEYKLKLLGVNNGRFEEVPALAGMNPKGGTELNLIISFMDDKVNASDGFFNAVLLAHLLVRFSSFHNFTIYNSSDSCGKMLLLSDERFCLSSLLVRQSSKSISYAVNRDRSDCEFVGGVMDEITTRDNVALFRMDMKGLCDSDEYQKTFLSSSTRCLIGHIPEFLLPYEIASSHMQEGTREYKDWKLAYNVINRGNNIKLLIYESALSEFMLDGRTDFFGRDIQLNIDERLAVLNHILMLHDRSCCEIRLVAGGFFDDFSHLPNPCIFLSDLICYFRVDDGSHFHTVYSVIHSVVKKMYASFFSHAWDECDGVVVRNKEDITKRLEALIMAASAIESQMQ